MYFPLSLQVNRLKSFFSLLLKAENSGKEPRTVPDGGVLLATVYEFLNLVQNYNFDSILV